MAKIMQIVGDFVEDYEAMVPYQMLLMIGHHVDTVCPNKKPGQSVKQQFMILKVIKPTLKNLVIILKSLRISIK